MKRRAIGQRKFEVLNRRNEWPGTVALWSMLHSGEGDDCISSNRMNDFIQDATLDGGLGNDIGGSTSFVAGETEIQIIHPFCDLI